MGAIVRAKYGIYSVVLLCLIIPFQNCSSQNLGKLLGKNGSFSSGSSGFIFPAIDLSKIPTGNPGVDHDLLTYTGNFRSASSDGTGDFRTVCAFSHMNFDDPIVFPGQPGRSHLHAFFGNTAVNAFSTTDSIANTGNSTCRGGLINRSAYWAPAMIDTRSGAPVKPRAAIVYYKSASWIHPSRVQTLPLGLRMIAGNSKGNAPVYGSPAGFNCDGNAVGSDATFPPTAQNPGPHSVPNCPAGHELRATVVFPRCWDGVNLDSPDHKSHMAYLPSPSFNPDPDFPDHFLCPPDHPKALPEVAISVVYDVTESDAPKYWRLASDNYDVKELAGYSMHADWFGGWRPEIIQTFTTSCINAAKDCGASWLGDGREMDDVPPVP